MNSRTQLLRRLAAAFVLVAAALPVAQAAAAQPDPPAVPDKIQVGTGHKVFLVGHAVGVQIYACKVVDGAPRGRSPRRAPTSTTTAARSS